MLEMFKSAPKQLEGKRNTVSRLEKDPVVSNTGEESERKRMRFPRSRSYVKAIKDAAMLTGKVEGVHDAIVKESLSNKLEGLLGQCFIEGCIAHIFDCEGNILEHYRSTEQMTVAEKQAYDIYSKIRNCVAVEIYTNEFCVVMDDGVVKIEERNK
jgi:hypothetical protein